jgi:hypothetical protein
MRFGGTVPSVLTSEFGQQTTDKDTLVALDTCGAHTVVP